MVTHYLNSKYSSDPMTTWTTTVSRKTPDIENIHSKFNIPHPSTESAVRNVSGWVSRNTNK